MTAHRKHPPRPPQICSPAKMKEHCLRLVFPVVGDRDAAGSSRLRLQACAGLFKGGIPQPASGLLHAGAPSGRHAGGVSHDTPAGHVFPSAQFLHKLQVLPGRFPQAVVDMHYLKEKPHLPGHADQHPEKAEGIRSSRDSGDNRLPRADHSLSDHILFNTLIEAFHNNLLSFITRGCSITG